MVKLDKKGENKMEYENFTELWNNYTYVYNALAEYFEDNSLSAQKLQEFDQVVGKLFIICNRYMK